MQKPKQFTEGDVVWKNISKTTLKNLQAQLQSYKILEEDIKHVMTPTQRSRVQERESYVVVTIIFPLYNPHKRFIEAKELNIFITEKTLITIPEKNFTIVEDYFNNIKNHSRFKKNLLVEPENILSGLLEVLIHASFPILEAMSTAINGNEEKIFAGKAQKLVDDLSITRRNVTDLRRIILMHPHAIRKLEGYLRTNAYFNMQAEEQEYKKLVDQAQEVWDASDNLKERIEVLQQTNDSLLSFRLNQTMRVLTTISAILMPPTLIAGIFGMNVRYAPFLTKPYDFWIIMGIELFMVLLGLYIFSRKGWTK